VADNVYGLSSKDLEVVKTLVADYRSRRTNQKSKPSDLKTGQAAEMYVARISWGWNPWAGLRFFGDWLGDRDC
jgi:hypothetical protein